MSHRLRSASCTRSWQLGRVVVLPVAALLVFAACSSDESDDPRDQGTVESSGRGGTPTVSGKAGQSGATVPSMSGSNTSGQTGASGSKSGASGSQSGASGSKSGASGSKSGSDSPSGAAGKSGSADRSGAVDGGASGATSGKSGNSGGSGTVVDKSGKADGGTDPVVDSGTPGPTEEIPMSVPTASNGQGEVRAKTTVLKSAANGGQDVYDFKNARIGVENPAGCSGEGQPAVFELEDGVTIKNLIVHGGTPGGNGIVCRGSCTLDSVYWEEVCEDAATLTKDGATMKVNHSIAMKAKDKVFQHNAKGNSTISVTNSYISTFGKLWRSCGDCTANGGPRNLVLDNVKIEGVGSCVAGANENYGDTVTISRLFVKGGYAASDDKPKICQVYKAVTDHNGESSKLYGGASQWDTKVCKVSRDDVKSW